MGENQDLVPDILENARRKVRSDFEIEVAVSKLLAFLRKKLSR